MIPIKNIYYMLAYAFRSLKAKSYKNLDFESFDNPNDLMAEILIKGLNFSIKQGIAREYINKEESLSTLRGRIKINESIKSLSMVNNKMVCTYDELDEDIRMNQIIKATIDLLIKRDIGKTRKRSLARLRLYFAKVSTVDLRTVDWDFQFNRLNKTYRLLMAVCFFTYKSMVQSQTLGKNKLAEFVDDQTMHRLYEKFILEYFKKHHPNLRPRASQIAWAIEGDIDAMLPIMQSDITLSYKDRILIIDAKFYNKSTSEYYGTSKLISQNIYQIFTYVKNKALDPKNQDKNVSGLVLYAKTDQAIIPNSSYMMSGNKIGLESLDLNKDFASIKNRLDEIAGYLS